jgi:uncharacterized protein (TIGR02266 family)
MAPAAQTRRFPRTPLQLRVGYKNFEGRTDFTRDVSVGGAFIKTANPVARGALLGLYFDLPSQEVPFEVGAEVIWCDASRQHSGMGVQFVYTSEEHRWTFERQLKKFSSG